MLPKSKNLQLYLGKKFVVITHLQEQYSCVSLSSMFSIQTYLEQWHNLIISSCSSQIQRWVPCCILLLHACIAAVNTEHTGLNCLNSLQVTALSEVACRWMLMWDKFGISGCSFPQEHGAGSGPPVVPSRSVLAGWGSLQLSWGPSHSTYHSRARMHSSPSSPSRTASWRAVLLCLRGRNEQCTYYLRKLSTWN